MEKQNKLFKRTQIYLALCYSGVMGVILTILGYGVYQAIAHAHLVTLDRELQSVAKTLHNSLELKLQEPEKIDNIVLGLLPDLCLNGESCFSREFGLSQGKCQGKLEGIYRINSPYLFKFSDESEYYLRLLDLNRCVLAFAGKPKDKTATYHHITILLHTNNQQEWGYLEVSRSFQDFDNYLNTIRRVFFLGLPVALILVGVSSWWLARLAMQPIYQSYQQMQQFSTDVAHELRTPLAAMQATLGGVMGLTKLDIQEVKESLEAISRQNQRLINLVRDLLLLYRLEQHSITKKVSLCCVHEIVNDLSEELAALAIKEGIELTVIDRVGQPVYVKGDLEQLYRLMANLISNAIQYTPPQGKVSIIIAKDKQQAIIQVEDNGIGIAKADLRKIFDRFYRVNSDRSRQTGGSGLGLAIAMAIAQSHQGTIDVKSEFDHGTIFTLTLPI